jgi:hypothetical protein
MKRTVLLVSIGLIHPSLWVRRRVHRLIRAAVPRDVPLRVRSSLRALSELDPETTGTVVLLFHRDTPPAGAVSALRRFAEAGGGVLALHAALASFKDDPDYAALLGGAFKGHDPPGLIRVWPRASSGSPRSSDSGPAAVQGEEIADPTAEGEETAVPAALPTGRPAALPAGGVLVTDELYQVDAGADIRVRAVGEMVAERPGGDAAKAEASDKGGDGPRGRRKRQRRGRAADPGAQAERSAPVPSTEPICWERREGRGRIAVVTLGHYAHTFAVEAVRGLVAEELGRLSGVSQGGASQGGR